MSKKEVKPTFDELSLNDKIAQFNAYANAILSEIGAKKEGGEDVTEYEGVKCALAFYLSIITRAEEKKLTKKAKFGNRFGFIRRRRDVAEGEKK